jgi:hypothetical protein
MLERRCLSIQHLDEQLCATKATMATMMKASGQGISRPA